MKTWLLFLGLAGCAVDPQPDISFQTEAIAAGTIERGMDSVVFVYNTSGSACTGAFISPRVVLTAKHCVGGSGPAPASRFRVYVGGSVSSLEAEYLVSEVRAAPGCWSLCGDNSDVAVLILASPTAETPLPVSFDSPSRLIGTEVTAVGYGQTASGASGTKYRTTTRVRDVYAGQLVAVDPSVCQGDSGGPLIGSDGNVYGVASFITSPDGRTEPRCGTAPGVYNGFAHLRDFIVQAIEDGGSCVPSGTEICDGRDNDCNDLVDETCTAIGEPCSTSDECVGGNCADTPSGRICAQACDPLRPTLGCPGGLYCARTTGCEGVCSRGAAGALGYDADCTRNEDCASLFCEDPGDGRRRCLTPCLADAGMCFAGEVCAAGAGSCGGCVAADIVVGSRGLGEPCDDGDECLSTHCLNDEGVEYCSRPCSTDAECGSGFHCRSSASACIRGAREGTGGGCVLNEDCSDGGICAARGESRWCTAFCTSDGDCPPNFVCTAAGGGAVCVPSLGLVGESCTDGAACLSGLCVDAGSGNVCTRFCDAENRCSSGLECVRVAGGVQAVCVAPPRRPSGRDEGCAVGGGSPSGRGGPGHAGSAVLVAIALALGLRTTRRGRSATRRVASSARAR